MSPALRAPLRWAGPRVAHTRGMARWLPGDSGEFPCLASWAAGQHPPRPTSRSESPCACAAGSIHPRPLAFESSPRTVHQRRVARPPTAFRLTHPPGRARGQAWCSLSVGGRAPCDRPRRRTGCRCCATRTPTRVTRRMRSRVRTKAYPGSKQMWSPRADTPTAREATGGHAVR